MQTTKLPVSATAKFAPVMPASRREIRSGVAAHRFREVVHVVIARLRPDRPRKHLRNVAAQLVDRGDHDVAGWLVVELLDALAEIGLDHLDAARLQKRTHVAFVGEHRLAFDQRLRAMRRQDVVDDLVVLAGVARPMHVRAIVLGLGFELLEIISEVRQRMLLDRRGEVAQLLPFGDAVRLPIALEPQVPEPPVVEFEMRRGLDEVRRRLGVVDRLHARAPVQDLGNVDEPDVEAEAFGASVLMHEARHVGGDDVLRAGPLMVVTLSYPIFAETGSSNTENVPPKPQHSSGRGGVTNWMPRTLRKRSSGLEKNGSSISDVLAVRSVRSDVQPLCSPTVCGNSAHGNSRTFNTSCTNSTSS